MWWWKCSRHDKRTASRQSTLGYLGTMGVERQTVVVQPGVCETGGNSVSAFSATLNSDALLAMVRTMKLATTALIAAALAVASCDTPEPNWDVNATRDEIRGGYRFTARNGALENGESSVRNEIMVDSNHEGFGVWIVGSLSVCDPAQPVIYRFDSNPPVTLPCELVEGQYRTTFTDDFREGVIDARRLAMENRGRWSGEERYQSTFNVTGLRAVFDRYPALPTTVNGE